MKETSITILVNYESRRFDWCADPEYNFQCAGSLDFGNDMSKAFDTVYDDLSVHFDTVDFEVYRPICLGDIVTFKKTNHSFRLKDGCIIKIFNADKLRANVIRDINYEQYEVQIRNPHLLPIEVRENIKWISSKDNLIRVTE